MDTGSQNGELNRKETKKHWVLWDMKSKHGRTIPSILRYRSLPTSSSCGQSLYMPYRKVFMKYEIKTLPNNPSILRYGSPYTYSSCRQSLHMPYRKVFMKYKIKTLSNNPSILRYRSLPTSSSCRQVFICHIERRKTQRGEKEVAFIMAVLADWAGRERVKQ